MKILITGGTGFIGKELGKALTEAGHELNVLTRNPERAQWSSPYPARFFSWNAETDMPPSSALRDVEGIVHLAGEGIASERWSTERKKTLRDSRIQGTKNLLLGFQATETRPQWMISASGVGYYGYSGDEFLSESSPRGEDFISELCEEWEQAALEFKESYPELRLCQMRNGVVLGLRGGFLGGVVPLFQRGLGAVLGSGSQWVSWIHIEDLIRLYLWCIENKEARGVYNATAPSPVTNKKLSHSLAERLNVGLLPPVPAPVLKLVYGEMAELLVKGQRVTSERLRDTEFEFYYPSFSLALTSLIPRLPDGEKCFSFEQWLPGAPDDVIAVIRTNPELPPLEDKFLRHSVEVESLMGGTLVRDVLVMKTGAGPIGRLLMAPSRAKRVGDAVEQRQKMIFESFSAH